MGFMEKPYTSSQTATHTEAHKADAVTPAPPPQWQCCESLTIDFIFFVFAVLNGGQVQIGLVRENESALRLL